MKHATLLTLLALIAPFGWSEDNSKGGSPNADVFVERSIEMNVEGAFWDSGAPETLYCRFPTRQWTRDKVASQQHISADAFDGTAVIKVGKEKTTVKQGKFQYQLHTLTASGNRVSAVSVEWLQTRHLSVNLQDDYALWTDISGSTITTFLGNCTAFEE